MIASRERLLVALAGGNAARARTARDDAALVVAEAQAIADAACDAWGHARGHREGHGNVGTCKRCGAEPSA